MQDLPAVSGARTMKEYPQDYKLTLTKEEALGLLDIIVLSPGDLSPEQRAAFVKLSELCRQFLREEEAAEVEAALPHGRLSPAACPA
jgi:hypothetical protein